MITINNLIIRANVQGKKAALFTLSMFLLASAILLLALVIANFTGNERTERLTEISGLDRMYSLSSSVENSVTKIFGIYSDVRGIAVKNPDSTYNFSITEIISKNKDDWGDEFEANIGNFKTFIEEKEQHIKLNLSDLEDKELPLIITPHNITYSRNWETGHVILSVVPVELNFGAYYVLVNSSSVRIDKVSTNFGSSGGFYLGVRAIDSYGKNIIKEKYVDPQEFSQIQVYFLDGNKVKITLDEDNLEIWTNSNTPIAITTRIGNLDATEEEINADYFKNAINTTFSDLDIQKISIISVSG